jgi:hypothetical protein
MGVVQVKYIEYLDYADELMKYIESRKTYSMVWERYHRQLGLMLDPFSPKLT